LRTTKNGCRHGVGYLEEGRQQLELVFHTLDGLRELRRVAQQHVVQLGVAKQRGIHDAIAMGHAIGPLKQGSGGHYSQSASAHVRERLTRRRARGDGSRRS